MDDVFVMLEGHWLTCFVSVTYSSHLFRWLFIPTTWNHPLFPMQFGGKTVCVEVEVVDESLDYNLLLGRILIILCKKWSLQFSRSYYFHTRVGSCPLISYPSPILTLHRGYPWSR
jgi:hypothetical protein